MRSKKRALKRYVLGMALATSVAQADARSVVIDSAIKSNHDWKALQLEDGPATLSGQSGTLGPDSGVTLLSTDLLAEHHVSFSTPNALTLSMENDATIGSKSVLSLVRVEGIHHDPSSLDLTTGGTLTINPVGEHAFSLSSLGDQVDTLTVKADRLNATITATPTTRANLAFLALESDAGRADFTGDITVFAPNGVVSLYEHQNGIRRVAMGNVDFDIHAKVNNVYEGRALSLVDTVFCADNFTAHGDNLANQSDERVLGTNMSAKTFVLLRDSSLFTNTLNLTAKLSDDSTLLRIEKDDATHAVAPKSFSRDGLTLIAEGANTHTVWLNNAELDHIGGDIVIENRLTNESESGSTVLLTGEAASLSLKGNTISLSRLGSGFNDDAAVLRGKGAQAITIHANDALTINSDPQYVDWLDTKALGYALYLDEARDGHPTQVSLRAPTMNLTGGIYVASAANVTLGDEDETGDITMTEGFVFASGQTSRPVDIVAHQYVNLDSKNVPFVRDDARSIYASVIARGTAEIRFEEGATISAPNPTSDREDGQAVSVEIGTVSIGNDFALKPSRLKGQVLVGGSSTGESIFNFVSQAHGETEPLFVGDVITMSHGFSTVDLSGTEANPAQIVGRFDTIFGGEAALGLNNATWTMTGNSHVTDVTYSGTSRIDVGAPNRVNALWIDMLSGNAIADANLTFGVHLAGLDFTSSETVHKQSHVAINEVTGTNTVRFEVMPNQTDAQTIDEWVPAWYTAGHDPIVFARLPEGVEPEITNLQLLQDLVDERVNDPYNRLYVNVVKQKSSSRFDGAYTSTLRDALAKPGTYWGLSLEMHRMVQIAPWPEGDDGHMDIEPEGTNTPEDTTTGSPEETPEAVLPDVPEVPAETPDPTTDPVDPTPETTVDKEDVTEDKGATNPTVVPAQTITPLTDELREPLRQHFARAQTPDWIDRFGLMTPSADTNGTFARVEHQTRRTTGSSPSKEKATTVDVGVKHTATNWTVVGSLQATKAKNDIRGSGVTLKDDEVALRLEGYRAFNNGAFVNPFVSVGTLKTTLDDVTSKGTHTVAGVFSGHRFERDDGWFITPYLGAEVHRLPALTLGNLSMGTSTLKVGRVGAAFGRRVAAGNVALKLDAIRTIGEGKAVKTGSAHRGNVSPNTTRLRAQLVADKPLTKSTYVNLRAGVSRATHEKTGVNVSVGLHWTF